MVNHRKTALYGMSLNIPPESEASQFIQGGRGEDHSSVKRLERFTRDQHGASTIVEQYS